MRIGLCVLTAALSLSVTSVSAAPTLAERVNKLEDQVSVLQTQARIFGVNDSALSGRIDKLEGKLTSAQVAGKYTYYHLRRLDGVDSSTETDVPYNTGTTFRGTITLYLDGSLGISGTTTHSSKDGAWPAEGPASGDGTWSWSGAVLTLSLPHEEEHVSHKFRHAAAGRLFLSIDTFGDAESPDDQQYGSEEWVEMLIRN